MTRLERHLRKSPNEKSLGPTIGGAPRNLNPFTAIDADKDLVVLEDIATVNFGEGVPDPTPGGVAQTPSVAETRSRFYATNEDFAVAAMTGPKRTISDSNPADMKNPDGHFPRENGPMWKDVNYVALNVAPRSRRGATPASVNTYLHAEWTEPYWDAVRDETGIWNSPPPPEMEVERAIYDAMKRETIEVGGYGAPFPRYPKESDYYEYDAGVPGYVVTALRPSRKFPFAETGAEASWTDGHPLYHATPTGLLPRIIADGLVGIPDRPLWFGASPSVWNEQWPDRRDAIRKAPAKGMSFLRISPTDEINGRLSRLANLKRSNPDTPAGMLAMDSEGKKIDVRDSDPKRAATLFGEAILFDDVKIPAENIEVLNQNGQWIPLYKADFSDVVFDPSGGVDAGMAKDKNRGVRRVLGKITNGKFGGEPEAETTVERPVARTPEDPRIALEFPVPQPRVKYSDSYGGDDLIKDEQIAQRTEHERLAASGSWSRIHSDHYDWWAYPIDRGSSAYGETFNVAGEPLERLKNDEEFISSLAREIEIQALALGWSLYDGDFLPQLDWERGQDWRKAYPTRLWKMTRSAQIFGLEREFESLLSLQGSLEAAGIRFNHSDYWNNPGTIDDVPSLGKSWTEREEERRQRFPASDATNWTSPYGPAYPSTDGGADVSPKPSSEEDNVWDAYDNYAETPAFSVVSDAEELADILSEPDDVIEFGYPYERIDKETRQLIADDIFFAISLLMDGEFPDEEEVDRRESAQQMRKYADEQDGLYPDDGDILYALADALEDPVSLYENAVYESTDSPDGEAGMGRKPSPEVRALVERVADMHNGGKSTTQIAEELGITRYRASNYRTIARRRGLLTSPRQRTAAEMNELTSEAARFYNEGKPRMDIAREMNLPVSTINNLLQRANERKLLLNYNPRGSGNFERTLRTPENIAAVAERYRQGKTAAQIAEELALTENAVIKLIWEARRLGLDAGPRRYRTSSELEELMLEVAIRYEEGKPMRKIAQELDADETTVQNLANRAVKLGLIRRDRVERAGDAADGLTKEIMAKLREGKSQRQIARELNVPYHRVTNLIKRARRVLAPDPKKARFMNSSQSLGDSGASDGEAGMSSELLKRATDDEAQLDLLYSIPGVRASVVLRNTDGVPTAPGKNAIAKPYFLAPHVDVNKMNPDDPVIKLLSPALRDAGLGTYPVRGHSVPKVQGPVVKDFADRLIGPSALADAVLGTFPTADEIVTIYAINALIRARAEYLSDSVLNADQVNTAILNGVQIGRNDDGADSGGVLWTPSQSGIYGGGFSITDVGAGPEARYTGTLDPFAYFTGRSDFLKSVVAALPEAVKSKLDPFLTGDEKISSWEDTSFFESIIIREDDKLSRAFAPMVRAQARTAVDHARRHEELTKKWAQTAYDMMKEAGLTDAEVAFVVNEHWANAAAFNLEKVRPGSVMGSAARLGVKAFSSRFSPITQSVAGYTFGEEEDYGLHEFFHHYLGQGFTRHGEYVAFRGPADLIDSYRGHLQWAWNIHGQLGMFVSKVMGEAFGGGLRPDGEPRALFDAIGRAIYDRLKEMLASPEDRRRIMDQIFPEFLDATTEDEARIKDLIRNQFLIRETIDLPFRDRMPALRLMTAHDFLVPKEYWPYGGTSRIIDGNER